MGVGRHLPPDAGRRVLRRPRPGPGERVADPYFGGAGPERTTCIGCGECMTGCRHNAKNTLVKNYLYLAEQNGARVLPAHDGDPGLARGPAAGTTYACGSPRRRPASRAPRRPGR